MIHLKHSKYRGIMITLFLSLFLLHATNISSQNNTCGVDEWMPEKAYFGGDRAYYKGYVYTATFWSQNAPPDANNGPLGKPWKDPQFCNDYGSNQAVPTISITNPTNDSSTSSNSVSVVADAKVENGTVSKVELYLNGFLKNTLTEPPYSSMLEPLIPGSNTIVAKAFNSDDVEARDEITLTYSPSGNMPPNVTITEPSNNQTLTSNNITVSANANDPDGSISKVEFYLNGVLNRLVISPSYRVSISPLKSGLNTIMVRAYDNNQVYSDASINVIFSASTGNNPPIITITSPSNGFTTIEDRVLVNASAYSDNSSISKVEFYLNNNLSDVVMDRPYAATIGTLSLGMNTITAKAFDSKDMESSANINVLCNKVPSEDKCNGLEEWNNSKIYVAGNQVREADVIYRANHWTQYYKPSMNHGLGKPWSVVSKCDGSTDMDAYGQTILCDGKKVLVWNPEFVYESPNVKVVYEGKIYINRYWTKGDIPGSSEVWRYESLCR